VQDLFGHRISYLRVSITDRCNERCRYCMPEEIQAWTASEETLSFDDLLRVVTVGAGLGIHKIRVTGGEPLTRPGAVEFCARLARTSGITDIGISTNGTLLGKLEGGKTTAKRLAEHGVRSVNISLDSLDRDTYRQTTGRDLLPRVLEGIEAAVEAGFESIKLNCVLIRGQTEREMPALVQFAAQKNALLRFIELMPVSTQEMLDDKIFLPVAEAKRLLEASVGPLTPVPEFKTNGPALYHEVSSTGQKIGFIGAMTNLHFCETCNKLRLTCDGKLRPCLGSFLEYDLRQALRSKCTDEELSQLILQVVAKKPKEHDFRNNYLPNRDMVAIGG